MYTTPKLLSNTFVGFNSPFHTQTLVYYYLFRVYFIATLECLPLLPWLLVHHILLDDKFEVAAAFVDRSRFTC